jgi:hypothetical protein
MIAKPTMPSAPADPDSTDRAMAAAAPALASIPGAAELPASGGRRPYEPPRILFREPLEAMAAICTPHPPAKANKGLCPLGPISS